MQNKCGPLVFNIYIMFGSLDGMWMVCFDQGVLTPGCVIYSFGIGSDWSFDEAMATGDAFGLSGPPRKGIGCAVHAFDPTMGLPSHVHQPGTVWFQPTALGAADGLLVEPSDPSVAWANGRAITGPRAPRWRQARLHTLLRDNGHRRLSLLKIDIESFEWAALAAALRDGALDGVDQLLFEAHLHLSSQQLQAAGGVGAFRSVLEALDAASFRLFSSVPNPFGNSTQLGPGGATSCHHASSSASCARGRRLTLQHLRGMAWRPALDLAHCRWAVGAEDIVPALRTPRPRTPRPRTLPRRSPLDCSPGHAASLLAPQPTSAVNRESSHGRQSLDEASIPTPRSPPPTLTIT